MVNGFSYDPVLVVMLGSETPTVVDAVAVPVGAWICPSEICETPVTVLCALVEAERRRMAREKVLTAMVCMVSGVVGWDVKCLFGFCWKGAVVTTVPCVPQKCCSASVQLYRQIT